MYDHNPDVTDENIGIRAFQVKKAKAAERAVERVRYSLGSSWTLLDSEEIEAFTWMLGELWAYLGRSEWDDLSFGRLTMNDVVMILTLGSQLRRHARPSVDILREVEETVRRGGAITLPEPDAASD